MIRIKFACLLLMAIPSLSFINSNAGSFISLTGFEIDYDKENNLVTLLTKYTSTSDSTSNNCVFNWSVYKDGNNTPVKQVRLYNFKKVTDQYLDVKPQVEASSLGEDNYFELLMLPNDTGEISSTKIHFNIKGKPQVEFSEKDNNIGVSSGFVIENYSSKGENKIYEDRVKFSNYEDLVVLDYYLNFDIRRFKYSYIGNKEKSLLEGDFYFAIYDKYNLFPDLPLYKESQYRYIPLKSEVFNGDTVFSFKNNIYYDPISHNPSISYKEGYIETNKLYFPNNRLDVLKSINCLLSFDIKGYTNFNMFSKFDIYFLKNYFGDCIDSEYCIEMNNDNGSNIREKVVDIIL